MAREMSSSIRDMFLPPKAVVWAEVGRFRKLNTLVLSWLRMLPEEAINASESSNLCLFFIISVVLPSKVVHFLPISCLQGIKNMFEGKKILIVGVMNEKNVLNLPQIHHTTATITFNILWKLTKL